MTASQPWARTTGVILILFSILCPGPVFALYEWQGKQTHGDARGLIRGFASAYQYPDDSTLFPDKTSSGVAGIARLIIDGGMGEGWGFEFNAYQTYIPRDLLTAQGNTGLPLSAERSAVLEKSFSNNDHMHLGIDRLGLRWSNQNLDLTIGRQAINLATTFYFTPNDFFAPFAAQTFYRVYKPGVDALRVEIGLGELSQLSLISVLGYQKDTDSDTGWSNRPDGGRTSHLMQWSIANGTFESTFLLGHVVDKNIIGGALQGELFEWLGIRMEGHHAESQESGVDNYQQLSLGLEHRWENSLALRLELFHNGLGANTVSQYQQVSTTNASQYLARRYSALSGSYEITPLLTGEALLISNLDDHSQLISLNSIYSLSDESEMALSLSAPFGEKPENGTITSEFGTYPSSINMEFRFYY